jgi:CBS domain-containing protein
MKLADILSDKEEGGTVSVARTCSVIDAVKLMAENRCGSVMVVDGDGRPEGIFTERDVLNLMAERAERTGSAEVGDVMTTELITARPDSRLDETLAVMTSNRCRHMPVLDEGIVVGVVSIGDLVKAKLERTEFEVESLREYIKVGY